MTSGWVGDDDSTFQGMRGCQRKIIYSAWSNYANFGCDIGGYRGKDSPPMPEKELFIRWAQYGAFLPLMENGGGGEHRPWESPFDLETLEIYKRFVIQHYRIALYLLQVGQKALDTQTSSIQPLDTRGNDHKEDHPYLEPLSYSYTLGDSILVHPVSWSLKEAAAKFNVTIPPLATAVEMSFPAGSQWLDWWAPSGWIGGPHMTPPRWLKGEPRN